MNISNKLMEEHQLILNYIALFKRYLQQIEQDASRLDLVAMVPHFIDFIRNYADRYHHAKEENILFKYMAIPGVLTHCNPLPVMLEEHDMGRELVGDLLNAIEEKNIYSAIEFGKSWASLLSDHINKEDNVLYVMAEEGLSAEHKQAIIIEYANVEVSMGGKQLDKKYTELYQQLAVLI